MRLPRQTCLSAWRSSALANAMYVSPTGFAGVPPPWPAIPVTASPSVLANFSRTPRAISHTVSSLTAPNVLRVSQDTPSAATLASYAYATTDATRYAELPGTFVKRCVISPPVHDSATARVYLFAVSHLPTTTSSGSSRTEAIASNYSRKEERCKASSLHAIDAVAGWGYNHCSIEMLEIVRLH